MMPILVAAVLTISSAQGTRQMEGRIHPHDCGKHLSGEFAALGGTVTVTAKCTGRK